MPRCSRLAPVLLAALAGCELPLAVSGWRRELLAALAGSRLAPRGCSLPLAGDYLGLAYYSSYCWRVV
ncbi:hypothetical protein AB0E69_37655 [Kribbella sp. NPDC026611]|uniref:hypothetical protein n=1 Tax=Kribbella sp. NPDC026611 TaxID=3154911 RepID=UPI0034066363